jgi:predicted RNase H-like HicB family nuclease
MTEYKVHANWDAEAQMWVAYSDDIPGLATEAETFEKLVERVKAVAPELLQLNDRAPKGGGEIRIFAERIEAIAAAA